MMPSLSPSADASAATPAVPAAPNSAPGNAFSSLIQGLQPVADPVTASMPATGPASAQAPAELTPAMTPAITDPLTSALASVLHTLGLSEAAPETALGSDDLDAAPADGSDTDSTVNTATILPAVPLQLPTLPALAIVAQLESALTAAAKPGSTTLANATSANSTSADATSADAAASAIAAPTQARQWLAAFAPAPQTESATPAAASGWQQPPLASFFNMSVASLSTTTDSSPISMDRIALTADGSALVIDAPKGLPSALNFAQTLTGASSTTPTVTTLLPHAVQDPAWADAFGQRVAMLAQQGTQTATLQLNPPELGPIQVRIAMSEQGARVEFNTLQQTTSDLIETAMPRLAAALEHQGLRLDDSRVNLVTTRQDVFNAQSAFSSARQDTPQGDKGQTAQQQAQVALRQSPVSTEQTIEQRQSIRLPVAANAAIDYYA